MRLQCLTSVRDGNRMRRPVVQSLVWRGIDALTFAVALVLVSEPVSAQATRVNIGLPDFSISFLSVKVAQSQSLFQAEGLEPQLIRISNPVAMIALMNKEIDYALSTGSVLATAVRGLPLKVVMYSLRRSEER